MADWSDFYKIRSDGPADEHTAVCLGKAAEILDLEAGQPVMVSTTDDGTVEIKPIDVEDQ